MKRRAFSSLGFALLPLAACSSDPDTIEVAISLGHETDALSAAPAVTSVAIQALDADGEVVASGKAGPGGEIDLGELGSEDFLSFEVRGVDASGATVLRGRSLGFLAGALDGDALPLFAQRLGGFSRPPGALPRAHVSGVAVIVGERWLLSTGGTSALDASGSSGDVAAADFYDLFAWDGAQADPLPRAAASIVARGTAVLLIDGSGATWFDFESGEQAEGTVLGAGLDLATVAGGATVEAPETLSLVVGATRSAEGAPTTAILRVNDEGDLSSASLTTARSGAAATWVDGVGLVVAGGSDEGGGVEVLGADDAIAHALSFPTSAVAGAALVAIGESTALRVGGVDGDGAAPTGVYALGCATDCAFDAFPDEATLPSITATRAFSTPRGVLAVGFDEDGLTRAFLVPLDRSAFTEIPLKEPRTGAAVTPAPNGTLAILGGVLADGKGATDVEMFFPE